MNDRTRTLLEYMLENAIEASEFANDAGSLEVFSNDSKTRKAVVMSLLNIGEQANHLPDSYTGAHPELPWRAMIALRNIAAHGYQSMSDDAIWDTVQKDLPGLITFLRDQLDSSL